MICLREITVNEESARMKSDSTSPTAWRLTYSREVWIFESYLGTNVDRRAAW